MKKLLALALLISVGAANAGLCDWTKAQVKKVYDNSTKIVGTVALFNVLRGTTYPAGTGWLGMWKVWQVRPGDALRGTSTRG